MSKKLKSNIILKSTIVAALFIIVAYVICWFAVAESLKRKLAKNHYKNDSWEASFVKAKIDGFPFKFRVELVDTKLVYINDILGTKVDLFFDSIKAETGPLFSHVDFTLSAKISTDIVFGKDSVTMDIITKKEHYLKLTEASFINSYEALKLLFDANYALEGLALKKLQYQANDSYLIDKKNNLEILRSDSDINLAIDSKSDGLINARYNSKGKVDFLASPYLKHSFHHASSAVDFLLELKRLETNYVNLLSLKVNALNITLDQSSLELSGTAKQNGEEIDLDLILKLKAWDIFLQELQSQELISAEQLNTLAELMNNITSQAKVSDAEIKICNQDGMIKVGNSDIYSISNDLMKLTTEK